MPTAKQLAKKLCRWQDGGALGSSDLGAIWNADPFKTGGDVVARLNGDVTPEDDLGEPAEVGQFLEESIIRYTESKLGKIRRNVERRVALRDARMVVHIDGVLRNGDPDPVEIKTSGVLWPFLPELDEWGETMTDEVPLRVRAQCFGHMLGLTDDLESMAGHPERCHVVALLGGRGFCRYIIPWHTETAHYIVQEVEDFWTQYVVPNEYPPEAPPSIQTLRRLSRQPGSYHMDNGEMLEVWQRRESAKAKIKEFEAIERQAYQDILAMLGTHEAAQLTDGRQVTFFGHNRSGFKTKEFKEAHPALYEEFETTSLVRQLRIRKAK
jgi:predicted phage-related endonuclease